MVTLYKSEFAKHEFDESTSTLFTTWLPETENMTAALFKSEMQEWLNAFCDCSPKYLYDACNEFLYPITPDEQIWMAHLLNPEFVLRGLKKYAHMVPADMITEMSVDQLFGEYFAMNLPNQYPIINFAKRQDALDWLYS